MERIEELYRKYLNGTISDAQERELFTLIKESDENSLGALTSRFLNVKVPEDLSHLQGRTDELLERIKLRIHEPEEGKERKLWRWLPYAAAVALIIGVSFFFYNQKQPANNTELTAQNDIAPGKNGATLTLAGGKKIRLDDAASGPLANEAGVSISKSADGQLIYEIKGGEADPNRINTLSTAKGETYKVRLPDGSLVYLNAASSLTYAASLIERGKRVVKLSGEGYFEISKDKAHPFVVKTEGQEVEVLGTHFNVNAYEDEKEVKTTLLEGSVAVSSLRGAKQSKVIKPGEQAALSSSGAIAVGQVNVEDVVDWKEGDFYFENIDFRSVMRKIGRWYDVEVVYDASVPQYIASNGVISRSNNLSAVLKLIERSGQVRFKIDGKKVIVIK